MWLIYVLVGLFVFDVLILLFSKSGKFHDREIEEEKKHWDNYKK